MSNIINGTMGQVISQIQICIAVGDTGKSISDGVDILDAVPGEVPGEVKSQVQLLMPVDQNGNSLV